MLVYIEGDLFTDSAEALVNPVNTIGVSGKGLAKEFAKGFPDNQRYYEDTCGFGMCRTGEVLVYALADATAYRSSSARRPTPKWIVNFPTKQHWRNPSKLGYIEQGLDDLVRAVVELKIKSIAIPKLGCGYGGLDWEDVKPLIEDFARQVPDVDVRVYI